METEAPVKPGPDETSPAVAVVTLLLLLAPAVAVVTLPLHLARAVAVVTLPLLLARAVAVAKMQKKEWERNEAALVKVRVPSGVAERAVAVAEPV